MTQAPMTSSTSVSQKTTSWVGAVIVGAAVFGVGILWERQETQQFQAQERAQVSEQLNSVRAQLEGAINQRIFATKGLEAYISVSRPDITQSEFEDLAAVILAEQSGVQSLALYEENVVSHIYPLEGNEDALGFDPTTNSEEAAAIERAVDSRSTVLAGPIELVEGGTAFISRTPIFLTPSPESPQGGQYWGLSGLILSQEELLEEAGLLDSDVSLQFGLRGRDGLGAEGDVFLGDESLFEQQDPELASVSVPSGSWQLAAIPASGWTTQSPWSVGLWVLSVVGGLGLGLLVFRLINAPTRLQAAVDKATAALQTSEAQLRAANEELEQRVQERTSDYRAIAAQMDNDNRQLREEVNQLLMSVSLIESGNLKITSQASGELTGLIAHTLNQLVTRLGQVLARVVSTSQEVTFVARNMEVMAQAVASNARQQSQQVSQVLELTHDVEQVASQSMQGVEQTNQYLGLGSSSIEYGMTAITELKGGIQSLQDGSDRIVQQMKTLGEFLGLADQFVQDQSQIAALTQVLALNAALVASRASEQRDPRQFMVVAREFEAIAEQVGSLAQQTNEGLATLEQRTSQIHTVVSAIDGEIQGLSGLVSEFTRGVDQSSAVFTDVRDVTQKVVVSAGEMSHFSHNIVGAAQATTQTLQEVTTLSDRAAQLTKQTESYAVRMESLSSQLLSSVQFFQLPALDTGSQGSEAIASPSSPPGLDPAGVPRESPSPSSDDEFEDAFESSMFSEVIV